MAGETRGEQWELARMLARAALEIEELKALPKLDQIKQERLVELDRRIIENELYLSSYGRAVQQKARELEQALAAREQALVNSDLGDFHDAAHDWILELVGGQQELGQNPHFRDEENAQAWVDLKEAIVTSNVEVAADAISDMLTIIMADFQYLSELPPIPDLRPPDVPDAS